MAIETAAQPLPQTPATTTTTTTTLYPLKTAKRRLPFEDTIVHLPTPMSLFPRVVGCIKSRSWKRFQSLNIPPYQSKLGTKIFKQMCNDFMKTSQRLPFLHTHKLPEDHQTQVLIFGVFASSPLPS